MEYENIVYLDIKSQIKTISIVVRKIQESEINTEYRY